ncbi:hypothetical protein ALC60_12813 [Trachymyrmex zeteki]|uniref:Uncharacterized protein n=1 Tax=Mycetomoellerius zeteki TaxID=64791 RepID=A0A151WK03_9HYME|nr:hypothetical protein ALC60_12813 [Trachymyrmex zeteki]
MIHNSQGIIRKGTLVRKWSIGPSLKQTLEVTVTRRCVRGRRSERGRAGAALSNLNPSRKKARTCVKILAQKDDAESLAGPRKTLLVHSESVDTCIGEQHIPMSVKRSSTSHRYRRLRRAMFHLLRGVCIGIFFSTLNTTG